MHVHDARHRREAVEQAHRDRKPNVKALPAVAEARPPLVANFCSDCGGTAFAVTLYGSCKEESPSDREDEGTNYRAGIVARYDFCLEIIARLVF